MLCLMRMKCIRNTLKTTDEAKTIQGPKEKTQNKKSNRKVSFNVDLIMGPTQSYSSDTEKSDQGGESSSSSEDSESSDESEEFLEATGTESEQNLDDYVLARDRERRKNTRPPSR